MSRAIACCAGSGLSRAGFAQTLGLPAQAGASADRMIGLRPRQRRGHGVVVGAVEFAAVGFGVRPPHCLKKKGTPAAAHWSSRSRTHAT